MNTDRYLFRGIATYGLKAGEWIYGSYARNYWNRGEEHGILPRDGGYNEVDPKTVGMFTGWTDTSDEKKMVFEGDILEIHMRGKTVRAVVRLGNQWDKSAFVLMYRSCSWDYMKILGDPFCEVKDFKVVGNVHDGSELAEVYRDVH